MSVVTETERSEDSQLREQAVERLKKRQDFRAHLLVYAMVNALLWTIWALTMYGGFAWPAIVSGGWGIGLVMNAWEVYGRKPISEAEVRAEIERLREG
jgi:hypothetical protein